MLAASCLALLFSHASVAEPQLLDRVVVRVNEGVVLESDVQKMMDDFKRRATQADQALPRELVLRTQVTERLINRQLQLSMAKRMGLKISDAQLDQTIANIARQEKITVEQLRQDIEKSGISFQDYRTQIREEITIGDVTRIAVRNRIQVSPQEISALSKMLQEESYSKREIHFGHIMVLADGNASKKEIEDASKRIHKIRELLDNGADFRRQATSSSQGPKALEGGDWGWMNPNEAPTIFADPLIKAKDGDLVGPIRSKMGFHILKVFDSRGVEVVEQKEMLSRHILLQPSIILSETKAKTMLERFVQQLRKDDSGFAKLAKEYSDDPGSGSQGGDLGWSNPDMYVPEFSATLKAMQPGEISDPFRTTHGWHIVQLQEVRTQDATEEHWQNRAYQIITNRKFTEESYLWLKEMRDRAYIELLDD